MKSRRKSLLIESTDNSSSSRCSFHEGLEWDSFDTWPPWVVADDRSRLAQNIYVRSPRRAKKKNLRNSAKIFSLNTTLTLLWSHLVAHVSFARMFMSSTSALNIIIIFDIPDKYKQSSLVFFWQEDIKSDQLNERKGPENQSWDSNKFPTIHKKKELKRENHRRRREWDGKTEP